MYEGKPLSTRPGAAPGRAAVPGSKEGSVPILRLYGVTEHGHSVTAHVHGFTPYFYVAAHPDLTEDMLPRFRVELDTAVKARSRSSYGSADAPAVLHVSLETDKASVYGYTQSTARFLKVFTAMPTQVSTARGILMDGFATCGFGTQQYQVYEANVPFPLRYMIDTSMVGCCWCECPGNTYTVRSKSKHVSRAQLEIDVVYDDMLAHAPEGDWQKIAPFRILSFDIECSSARGHFPEATRDPVIQIANVITCQGASSSTIRNVMTLDTCTPIVGVDVRSHATEAELLSDWAAFLQASDPDIITGYNVQNFDIPYLLNRADTLGLRQFSQWGRILGQRSVMSESTFQSAAYGKRKNVDTSIPGRVVFDMLQYMRRNHKLSSYSLNAVSAEFLGQQKEDVHHSIIADLQAGSADDRHRLAVYCLKDAFLPQRLMDKLMVMVNHIEMSRVTGVPLDYLLNRGQQIKVQSMLYRKCVPKGLLIPVLRRQGSTAGVAYEGATVIEPIRGFYDEPIATLDFASLYPSIMMAHNLCYSTLLTDEQARALPDEEVTRTPSGHTFAKASTRKGVLPEILEELLSARKRAKKDMAAATDPMVRAVQNGRQLALKISANSVYGFTGATVGQLPCLAISGSVTAYGRTMIETTKEAVERMYTRANGFAADAQVVYGDTDSVMVKFGLDNVKDSMAIGLQAATEVSTLFPPPVKLEFEKVYFPYLLMNKKRYAGMYWTKPDHWDKMDAKGIETVRRDNCALVRQLVDTVLRKILMERSVASAVAYTKSVIADLLQNRVDISLLVITKALSGTSADYKGKQAHVELAERMRERDPGSAPVVGDRVPYVIIQAPKNTPGYLKSEDPIYVLEHGLPIDTEYYLHNQLEKPLLRIFGPIVQNPSTLLTGAHTKKVTKAAASGSTGIARFAVKREKCLAPGCNVPLSGKQTVLCARCAPRAGEILRWKLAHVSELQENFARLWTQCQHCQGSLHQPVICTARDCPIFYMRKKVQKELGVATEQLAKFDMEW